jgi:hypothetical protein
MKAGIRAVRWRGGSAGQTAGSSFGARGVGGRCADLAGAIPRAGWNVRHFSDTTARLEGDARGGYGYTKQRLAPVQS